jgi:hypothetical protein
LFGSPQVLRTPSILIECTSFQRIYTGLSKCRMHACYARLGNFLVEHGYVMRSVDKNIFTLNHGNDFLLVQIYLDHVIFGGSSHILVSGF